jgi:membrane protease YdiL (CAAX protease family)
MDFIQKYKAENSAYVQLLILAAYALVGAIVSLVLGAAILLSMYGINALAGAGQGIEATEKILGGIKIIQMLSTVALFLAPPIFLAMTEGRKVDAFYGFKRPSWMVLGLVLLIMIFSLPLMEYIALLNQKMTLPGILKPIEDWMRQKEDEMARTTVLLLTVRQPLDFLVNLLMIAILPAIAEELMFRGGIQRAFMRMFKNPHVAIWITAIIFSAIHVQFFGFFPRLFLGALFGYLYLWTKSLWYTMFAHFLNNGYAVCVAFYLQKHDMPLDAADNSSNFHWYGYLLSFIFTALLLYYFKIHTDTNGKQLD